MWFNSSQAGVRAVELAVQLSPGEPQRSAEREGAVDQPQAYLRRPATVSWRCGAACPVEVFISPPHMHFPSSCHWAALKAAARPCDLLVQELLVAKRDLYNPLYRVRHRNTAPPPIGHGPTVPPVRPHAPPELRRTAAAHPPLPPGQPGPLRERRFCFTPPRACSAVQPGVFRGSELRFILTIMSVIVSMNLPTGTLCTGGRAPPRAAKIACLNAFMPPCRPLKKTLTPHQCMLIASSRRACRRPP